MKCPKCNVTLVMADKQGVEIDYCPDCRGIWLDRGELDKIIERSASYKAPQTNPPKEFKENYHREVRHNDYHHDDYNHKHHKKRQMSNFLEDIFDFG